MVKEFSQKRWVIQQYQEDIILSPFHHQLVKPITSYGEYEKNQSKPFTKQENFHIKKNWANRNP